MRKTNKKGFTLVELLVVIAIIAIIAAVAVPVTIGQINKAKISTAAQECGEVKNIVIQDVQDLAIKNKLDDANLLAAIQESYTKFEQVTKIIVATDGNKITVTVRSDVDGTKADEENKITDGSVYVGVTATMPAENIKLHKVAGDKDGAATSITITFNKTGSVWAASHTNA